MERAEALAKPLQDFATWHLMVWCKTCRDSCRLPVSRIPAQSLGAALPRLRCSRCRQPPVRVVLANRPRWAGDVVEVVLLGLARRHISAAIC